MKNKNYTKKICNNESTPAFVVFLYRIIRKYRHFQIMFLSNLLMYISVWKSDDDEQLSISYISYKECNISSRSNTHQRWDRVSAQYCMELSWEGPKSPIFQISPCRWTSNHTHKNKNVKLTNSNRYHNFCNKVKIWTNADSWIYHKWDHLGVRIPHRLTTPAISHICWRSKRNNP